MRDLASLNKKITSLESRRAVSSIPISSSSDLVISTLSYLTKEGVFQKTGRVQVDLQPSEFVTTVCRG